MKTVFVDLDRTGRGGRFYTDLFRWERDGLQAGDIILVRGDSVPERSARLIAANELGAELEFLDEVPARRGGAGNDPGGREL
jgi:hypothetical protein